VQPLLVLDEANKMWSSKPRLCDDWHAAQKQASSNCIVHAKYNAAAVANFALETHLDSGR
jgi:hypothetical protein